MANPPSMPKEDVLTIVRGIAEDYGVPEWVWRPIMNKESGGNPNSWNDPRKNKNKEDSRGLFQINLKAHPQWKNLDLFDPVVNAKLAFPNFIVPAWNKVKADNTKSDAQKTAYVWKNGIRPKWTEEKNKAIQDETFKIQTLLAKGTGGTASGGANTVGWGSWINPFGGAPYGDSWQYAPGIDTPGVNPEDGTLGDPRYAPQADPREGNPDYITLIPSFSLGIGRFPGIYIPRSGLWTAALWIVGILLLVGFFFILAKGGSKQTIVVKDQSKGDGESGDS